MSGSGDIDGDFSALCFRRLANLWICRATSLVSLANRPTDDPVTAVRHKARYHRGLVDLELEQAVSRAAQQYHIQPALLLAVMKAESSLNPTVASKAGAVGLMQLISETAIHHGVRNLYDTNDNITGGVKHLRTSWTGSTETSGHPWLSITRVNAR